MAKSQGIFYENLGKKIRSARVAARITQHELAGAVNLTRTSITNIERGRQPVMAHVLARIASVLNVTVEDLVPVPEVATPRGRVRSKLRRLEEPKREWVERIISATQGEQKG